MLPAINAQINVCKSLIAVNIRFLPCRSVPNVTLRPLTATVLSASIHGCFFPEWVELSLLYHDTFQSFDQAKRRALHWL